MNRFQRAIQILDDAIGGRAVNIGYHGAFWRGLTRDQFIVCKVYGRDLVKSGDGAGSNLVKALKGESPFGADLPTPPPGALYDRMPDGLLPVTDADIAFIQNWIDEGCPEDLYISPTEAANVGGSSVAMRWVPTNAPTVTKRYNDIWFLDPNVGWAVDTNGQVLHTSDGENWGAPQLHVPYGNLRCISFASSTLGWVGSLFPPDKILYETRDGATWVLVPNLPANRPSAVCGLWVVNESVVYAAGSNAPEQAVGMIKTIDGGKTWSAWDMRPWADNLIDVYFPSIDHGWVVGGRTDDPRDPSPAKANLRPVVLYTEDGGRSWVDRVESMRSEFPRGEWGWKIQFLDDRTGFVSLQNYEAGAILTTIDGGLTWTRRQINDPQKNANLEGIGFIDGRHGWVGGWGDRPKVKRTSSETFDGGVTWRDANEIGKNINRFRFFGNPVTAGYATGETIYKYGPTSISAAVAEQSTPIRQGRLLKSLERIEVPGRASVDVTVPVGASRLTVRIWDPDGPPVRTLIDELRPAAGDRSFSWDRTDDRGQLLPIQSFICRVTVDETSESTLVVVR
jgi:photosystem II stability/assembly factor-like uncharacterized protein